MVTTYETIALMISFSMLVLAIVNTVVNIIIQINRYQKRRRHHRKIKK